MRSATNTCIVSDCSYLYLSNASSITPSDMRVCSCSAFRRGVTSVSLRKADMRSWMRAHSWGKGSGESAMSGEAGVVLLLGGATVTNEEETVMAKQRTCGEMLERGAESGAVEHCDA